MQMEDRYCDECNKVHYFYKKHYFQIPKCDTCKKICSYLFTTKKILRKDNYFKCQWCEHILRNTETNRREHGIKCVKRILMEDVCHCYDICVICLQSDRPLYQYYHKCGCSYCVYCYLGENMFEHEYGHCSMCACLGTETYIKESVQRCKIMYGHKVAYDPFPTCNIQK